MFGFVAAAMLMSLELPPEEKAVAGAYAGAGAEIAAELVLQPDGRYRYALSHGALNERSAGVWRVEDGAVLLNGDEATPPLITFTDAGEAPAGRVETVLVLPDGLDARFFALQPVGGARADPVPVGTNGATVLAYDPAVPLRGIRMTLPLHDIVSPVHPLDLAAGGRSVRIDVIPNDLGHVMFEDTELPVVAAGGLEMARFGKTIRFRRR